MEISFPTNGTNLVANTACHHHKMLQLCILSALVFLDPHDFSDIISFMFKCIGKVRDMNEKKMISLIGLKWPCICDVHNVYIAYIYPISAVKQQGLLTSPSKIISYKKFHCRLAVNFGYQYCSVVIHRKGNDLMVFFFGPCNQLKILAAVIL